MEASGDRDLAVSLFDQGFLRPENTSSIIAAGQGQVNDDTLPRTTQPARTRRPISRRRTLFSQETAAQAS